MATLAEMSWPLVKNELTSGNRTVLFAAGSTEQHGPHLPLLTDTLLGDVLADRVAAQLSCLRAPTLPLGVSPHHMSFPGTISLSPETFKQTIRDYVSSLAAHGFETVIVVPSHGGNFSPLQDFVQETGGVVDGARLVAFTDLMGFIGVLESVGEADGMSPEISGSHAGEAETSLVLAMRPELVDMSKAAAGFDGRLDKQTAARLFADGTRALSDIGVLGDARPATAERGQRYLSALVDLIVASVQSQLSERATP